MDDGTDPSRAAAAGTPPTAESNRAGRFDRRTLLAAVGGGLAGTATVGTVPGRGQTDGPEPSVTFEDQHSDGRSVTVAAVSTDVDAVLPVFDVAGNAVSASPPVRVDAGETATDVDVPLDGTLEESQRLTAALHERNGPRVAEDSAFVSVGDDEIRADGMPVTLVRPDGEPGFDYPYYLYAPPVTADAGDADRPILVHPNNTGRPSDDLDVHRADAERRVTDGLARRISDELAVPLLVPAFPRPESEPVDDTHLVHNLDTETMHVSSGPLERVDLQLRRMVEHARARLSGNAYPVAETVIMDGFSSAGIFVNRFATLHPDLVDSVTAGGINGMAILPISEAKGHTLNYQIGVADLESVTGEPFDRDRFVEVDQFLYMGQLDGNDSLPPRYVDAWSDEQREIALDVYGVDMQRDRFPYCQSVYEEVGASAYFEIYERVGHTPQPAIEDVIEFHRRAIAGEPLDEFGEDLGEGGGDGAGPEAAFEFTPRTPAAGEPVEFDASASTTFGADLVGFAWEFADGRTAAGVRPTHAFDRAGEFDVTLSVVDDAGRTDEATRRVTVGGTTGDRTTGGEAGTDADAGGATGGGGTAAAFGAGFLGGVAGLAGVQYLLGRRADPDER